MRDSSVGHRVRAFFVALPALALSVLLTAGCQSSTAATECEPGAVIGCSYEGCDSAKITCTPEGTYGICACLVRPDGGDGGRGGDDASSSTGGSSSSNDGST